MNGKVRSIVALLAILTLVFGLVPLAACDGDVWEIIPTPSTSGTLILDDVMPSPDGDTLFLSTTFSGTYSILWKSLVPGLFGSWDWQLAYIASTPDWIIRLGPDWADNPTIYWCDRGGTDIMRSVDGGTTFVHRTAPGPITDVAVESAVVLYMISGTNVYASTTGGWNFGLPSNPGIGVLADIAMAPDYPQSPIKGHVLVGGTAGAVALSTAGAAAGSFIPLPPLPVGGNVQVCADTDYATNSIIYAGSSSGGVYRYLGGSCVLIDSTIASVSGLVTDGGCLYAADATPGGGVVGGGGHLTNGLSGGETFDREPNALRCSACVLFAIDTTGNKLYRYED